VTASTSAAQRWPAGAAASASWSARAPPSGRYELDAEAAAAPGARRTGHGRWGTNGAAAPTPGRDSSVDGVEPPSVADL
jgi:hypothetical protein